MTSCSPLVVSVSSTELGDAVVVSVMEARFWLPVFCRSTARWMVSPGTMPVALTVIRFVAPAAGMVRASVPEVTVSGPPTALAVKDEYVPAPMAVAPAATTASVSSTLPRDTLLFMWRAMVDLLGVGPTRAPHPCSRSVTLGVEGSRGDSPGRRAPGRFNSRYP